MPLPRGSARPRKLPPRAYSVLLLYPSHMNEGGLETFYAHVTADDVPDAISAARAQAALANPQEWRDAEHEEEAQIACGLGFEALLVIEGHHHDLIGHQ
jgi:hypothetical protein